MWTTLKLIFDTFGNYIFVPVILFVIALIMKAPVKKAFQSAVLAGVGLKGFSFITSSFGAILTPLVTQIVNTTGLKLPALDIGWQAVASIAYSTNIGMMFIGVGLIFQIVLFIIKWTDIFMPSDLWNNYSIIVWGSMLYALTQNLAMAFVLMLLINMVTLLFAEMMQKRWSTYYNYPGTAMTAPHHMGSVPYYLVIDYLLNLVGADKVNLRPESIREKIGFLGEPMIVGLIVGMILGVVGNVTKLSTIAAWGQIANVAVTTAAVMAIFPKIAGIFAGAFTTLTEYSKKAVKSSGAFKDREIFISVNDALGYGEAATLTTGLLVIPFAVLIAFILPGNLVIPLMVLPSLPYMVEVPVSLSDGNIFKSVIGASIVFCLQLWMASSNAEVFTQIAREIGFAGIPTETVLVVGFIISNLTAGLIFKAFLTENPFIIGAVAAVYFVAWFLFKKNKPAFQEYLENNATKYKKYASKALDAVPEAA